MAKPSLMNLSKATVLKTEYSSQKVSDWDKASVSSCCWGQEIL
jgi:hypothetical protein